MTEDNKKQNDNLLAQSESSVDSDEGELADSKPEAGAGESEVYELGFLLKPSLSDQEVEDQVEKLKGYFIKFGGEIIAEGWPKMLALAYTMEIPYSVPREKYDHAYFGWIKAELSRSAVKDLETLVAGDQLLVRSLLIKTVRADTMAKPKVPEEVAVEDDNSGRSTVEVAKVSYHSEPEPEPEPEPASAKEPETNVQSVEAGTTESQPAEPKPEIDEDDIDKSIEDLIVS